MSFPTLPDSWVDEIFAHLAVTYGSDWLLKWEGMDDQAVKAKWAKELGGFVHRKDAIVHALKHLPVDRPPNVLQFRVICLGAPADEAPAAAAKVEDKTRRRATPKDAARLKAAMARYHALRLEAAQKPKQWAYDLQAREMAGEALTMTQRTAWRDCLAKIELRGGPIGDFNPVPNEALPPGMRKKERHHEL